MKWGKLIAKVAGSAVILLLVAGTVWDFSSQLQGALQEDTYRTLNELSEHYNLVFLDRMENHIKMMNVVADGLGQRSDLPPQLVIRSLQSAVDNSGFKRMAFVQADGMSRSNSGEQMDVSSRDYFRRAMRGETVVSEPLRSLLDGVGVIVISVPVLRGGVPVGALSGSYSLSEAGHKLLDAHYDSGGYGFILSKNGDIIISSNHADRLCREDNLLRFFERVTFLDLSIADLKSAMAHGESGSFAFLYKGARRFANFMPSGINDWYTFSLAADTLVVQQEARTNRLVFLLGLKLLAVGIPIALLFLLSKRRHSREMVAANQRYQSLLANINGGVLVTTGADRAQEITPTYVSEGFIHMTGYTGADIAALYGGEYICILHPEDREQAFLEYMAQVNSGTTYRMAYRIIKKDGAVMWVMDTGSVVRDENGKLLNHSMLTDITVIKQQEEQLRLVDERFRIVIDASNAAVVEVDLQTRAYAYFENTEPLLGFSPQQLLADTAAFAKLDTEAYITAVKAAFFHPEEDAVLHQAFQAVAGGHSANFEARLRRADGSYLWCKIDMGVIRSEHGTPLRAVGYVTDISGVKRNTERLETQVQTDTMTGLYNKMATAALADELLAMDVDARHALIVLDVDNFKGVNDTLGHAFGDAVLLDVCTKLKALFRSDDIVGRIGGDEFAILMKNVPDTNRVLRKAAEIAGAFRQTYTGEKRDYKISCSMGIIMTQGRNDRYETLLHKADVALYQAKRKGKDLFVLYREEDAAGYLIESTRMNDTEAQRAERVWNIEEQIFELLYTTKDFSGSVNMALAMIGRQYHISRAYVFENDADNRYTSNSYEWCDSGVAPAMGNLQNLQIAQGEESLLNCFDSDGLFYCNDVRTLPPYARRVLEAKGILSTLQRTIVDEGKIGGFIGFDACGEYRIWTADEISTISFLAKILSVFVLKKQAEAALLKNLNSRIKILDSLPDYICVVNPETHCLEYANSKMQELLPAVQSGALCYSVLRGGQRAPCETCLIERIRRGDTGDLEIVSEDGRVRLNTKAISIDWTDQKEMVLLYGTIWAAER